MIECIFTVDYEIYGNGEGSLRELILDPTEKLKTAFQEWKAPFVLFVETAELEKIEECRSDNAIEAVRRQIRELHTQGVEIGLHLHPQWFNARHENGKWLLDYNEYNLCTLPRERIAGLIERSIAYLRGILGDHTYTPLSFRAGNWLLQPSKAAAGVLAEKGIKIDSSVFKGGLQRNIRLDYRPALRNGYYWRFSDNANIHDSYGSLLEIPTFVRMVPIWRMLTNKRVGIRRGSIAVSQSWRTKMRRFMDYLRIWYPLKLDFCRMTSGEFINMVETVIKEDRERPSEYRPLVAIGHTKDLFDFDAIESLLSYLRMKGIPVTTFREVLTAGRTCVPAS